MDDDHQEVLIILRDLNMDPQGTGVSVPPDQNKYFSAYDELKYVDGITADGFNNSDRNPLTIFLKIALTDMEKLQDDPRYVGPLGFLGIVIILKYFFNRDFRLHSLQLGGLSTHQSFEIIIDQLNDLVFRFRTTLNDQTMSSIPELVYYVNSVINSITELRDLLNEQWQFEESGQILPIYNEISIESLELPIQNAGRRSRVLVKKNKNKNKKKK